MNKPKITTALLLAAGTGSRLMPITSNAPKCLTELNDTCFLERLVINLKEQGFKKLIIITGHEENCIREFLPTIAGNLILEFVFSPLYKTTNNIYSLWMARDIIREPFVLFEGDLIFDSHLLDNMVFPDRIAVSHILPWMNGTTVTVNPTSQKIKAFHKNTSPDLEDTKFKTVNIYSFSLESWKTIVSRLNQHIEDGKVNGYYETVFAELVEEGALTLDAVDFDNKHWYEVDTLKDLEVATQMFSKIPA
jgi:choline kinase